MKILTLCKPYLIAHKYALGIYIALTFTTVIITILSPYILGDFIDNLIQGAGVQTILRFCFIFGGLNLVRIIKGYITSLLYVKMHTQMGYDFTKAALQHVQRSSLSYSNKADIAYLNNRITTDANTLIGFSVSVLQSVLTNAVVLVVPFFILFSLNGFIASLMLGFLALYMVLYFACKKKLYEVSFILREKQAKYFSGLLEQLRHIKLIKTHAVQNEINQRADVHFTGFNHAVVRNQKVNYLYSGMDGIISTIAQIVLFVIGGLQILYGNFTIGMFTIFTSYFNMILSAVRYFYGLGATYQNAMASHSRLQEVFGQQTEAYGTIVLNDIKKITFQGVNFSYDAEGEKQVICNFNTALSRGNMYAITGGNGAGKSTLTSLLLGLYINEFTGVITYNDTDIRQINMNAVRKTLIGYAAQEPILINDSIQYNLVYNNGEINAPHLQRCIEVLNMGAFFAQHNVNFEINELNNNISGGEKQKIAILSVLYKNPEVMIFDEPTSALDAQTTKQFMDYLHEMKRDKIIVIITHDEAVKMRCDGEISPTAPSQHP
ncbi:MAG: ABC transporter ATP-binding protein/permease [Defluviitaleaceae bacterium]|nr:ABC transporter ATP-binding protein/permease [Defluviitaleaceae bacterium]MCL2274337.1 ABC transporter ATP-binding protein/permease [Defluviitaleaceae bacterium]